MRTYYLRAHTVYKHTHTHTHTHVFTVVGEKEETHKTVNVRTRDNVVHGEKTVDELIARLKHFREARATEDKGEF